MPSSNKKPSKKQTQKLLKQRKKLRALGLISERRDLRRSLNSNDRKALREYAGVLAGRDKIVKAPDQKSAAKFKRIFKVKKDKIIVPVEKGEKPKFDKASGNIISKRIEYGRERTKIISAETPSRDTVPKGRNKRYVLPLMRGRKITRFSFLTFEELEDFVYKTTLGRSFTNWAEYVEVEEIGKRIKGKKKKRKLSRAEKAGIARRVEIRERDEDGENE